MPQRSPRRRRAENAAFLAALAETGNARLAARSLGVHRAAYTKRRARDPAFAAAWDIALAAAQAKILPQLAGGGGPRETRWRGPERSGGTTSEPPNIPLAPTATAAGRLQLRAVPPSRIAPADEAAFLAALEETGSIRRAAALAGFAHTSFLARARRRPALAREIGIRAAVAADRDLFLSIERGKRDYDFDPDIPLPKMSVEEAMFLLHLHDPDGRFQRSVWRRRRPPRPIEHFAPRIMAKARAIRRGAHWEKTGSWRFEDEE